MNRRIGVVLSYVLMIFEILSTLLLTPFIISTLGQAEYGVYKLAAAINSFGNRKRNSPLYCKISSRKQ